MTTTSKPLISVLIPSYNHQDYIVAAIESVLAQTYSHWELVIVDDASTDQTWSLVQTFSDSRIKSFRNLQNQGAFFCLDEAFKASSGEYIAILNSDDCFKPERLEKLLSCMQANDYSAIFTDVRFVDGHSQELAADHPRLRDYQRLVKRNSSLHCSSWFLSGNPAISTSNLFYRRSAAKSRWQAFPLRYTHDWAWCLEQSAYGRLGWHHEPLLDYRVHSHNTVHEPDSWRHRHENAWILGYAIQLLPLISAKLRGYLGADDDKVVDTLCTELLFNHNASPLMVLMLIARQRASLDHCYPPLPQLFDQSQASWWAEALVRGSGYFDTDPLETLHELLARQCRERALWDVSTDLISQLVQTKAHPGERIYQMVQLHQDFRELSASVESYQHQIAQLQSVLHDYEQLKADLRSIQNSKLYRLRMIIWQSLRCLRQLFIGRSSTDLPRSS